MYTIRALSCEQWNLTLADINRNEIEQLTAFVEDCMEPALEKVQEQREAKQPESQHNMPARSLLLSLLNSDWVPQIVLLVALTPSCNHWFCCHHCSWKVHVISTVAIVRKNCLLSFCFSVPLVPIWLYVNEVSVGCQNMLESKHISGIFLFNSGT